MKSRPPPVGTGPGMESSAPNARITPNKGPDGKYTCQYCYKVYLHLQHLKRHHLRHTGERPYQCCLCHKTFYRSDTLKRHFQKCSLRRRKPTGASHLTHAQAHLGMVSNLPTTAPPLSASNNASKTNSALYCTSWQPGPGGPTQSRHDQVPNGYPPQPLDLNMSLRSSSIQQARQRQYSRQETIFRPELPLFYQQDHRPAAVKASHLQDSGGDKTAKGSIKGKSTRNFNGRGLPAVRNAREEESKLLYLPVYKSITLGMGIPQVTDEILEGHMDPFCNECRAFGKIEEHGLNGKVAVACYGFMAVPAYHVKELAQKFGINEGDWEPPAQEYFKSRTQRQPLRAIVKEWISGETGIPPRAIKKASQDLKEIRKKEVYPMDIRARNYVDGRLVDLPYQELLLH